GHGCALLDKDAKPDVADREMLAPRPRRGFSRNDGDLRQSLQSADRRAVATCHGMGIAEISPAPRARRLARPAPKQLAEVRLVSESARKRDLTERVRRAEHQPSRTLEPQANDVFVRRVAERFFECPTEVAHAERDLIRQLLEMHRA